MSNLNGIPKSSLGDDLSFVSPNRKYTPVFTNFGVVTGINFRYCKVGPNLYVSGTFTMGTGAAAAASFSLPFSASIDFTIVPNNTLAGRFNADSSGTWAGPLIAYTSNPKSVYVSSDGAAFTTALNGNTWSAGTSFSVFFSIPLLHWNQG